MYVECYDEVGAQVYDTLLRHTLQDLKLARAISAIKIFIDPREALFIGVVKLEKASQPIYLTDMAKHKMENGILKWLSSISLRISSGRYSMSIQSSTSFKDTPIS